MSKGKARGLIVSDLVVPTGFSRVSHSIFGNLVDDFELEGLGINYRGDPHKYNFPIYPASTMSGNIYGIDRLVQFITENRFDFIFFLNDAWVISYYLAAIKQANLEKLPKIIVYFPVDSEHHDEDWYKDFDLVHTAVTYTTFAKNVLKESVPELNVKVLPHGIDKKIFYRKYPNRALAKTSTFKNSLRQLGKAEELWVALSANRNQPRKRLDITMKGFAEFAKDKPPFVKLYMHCGVKDASIDIIKMARRLGIEERLIITSLVSGVQKVSEEKLNDLYNASDVGITTSMGEGWGLTSIEHAMTYAPQIVPNHSACKEIFEDVGVVTPVSEDAFVFDNTMTEGYLPTIQGVAEGLELLYSDRDYAKELAEKAVAKFSKPQYQWENIAKKWKQLIEDMLNDSKLASRN